MTKKKLRRLVLAVIGVYAVVLAVGVALAVFSPRALPAYKDLLVVDLAIPAAWLAYGFQRRLSYMDSLRALWSRLVHAVWQAVEYTHETEPTRAQWRAVLLDLEIAIDETRQVFKNLDEGGPGEARRGEARRRADHDRIGHYPFEPLKEIRDAVIALGPHRFAEEAGKEARELVVDRWSRLRIPILSEFERDVPEHPVTPFAERRPRAGRGSGKRRPHELAAGR